MKNRNIIFLDIDGTLTDFDGYIPLSAVESIRRARELGHRVFISTGRPYWQIEEHVKNIGFDGIIAGAGSYIEYEGRCIKHEYFSQECYYAISNFLLGSDSLIIIQCYNNSYLLKESLETYYAMKEKLKESIGENADKLMKMPSVIKKIEDLEKVEKIVFFSNEISVAHIEKEWSELVNVVNLSIPSPEKNKGEISPIYTNKAEGIKTIIKQIDNEYDRIIAIGDSDNDIEMLQIADVGIAMGNATEKLKQNADIITTDLKKEGIKKAFECLGLFNGSN